MEYKWTLMLSILLLVACDNSNDDYDSANLEPAVPELLGPANNFLSQEQDVNFQWTAVTDPDGDAVIYNIQVSKNANFTQIAYSGITETTSESLSLDFGKPYYWRVRTVDERKGTSAYSPRNQFYIVKKDDGNYPPFQADLVQPGLDEVIDNSSITLEWTCFDLDDTNLKFDVYLSTEYPPMTKISSDQISTSLNLSLDQKPVYYWRVIAKDNSGGESVSPIWYFKT